MHGLVVVTPCLIKERMKANAVNSDQGSRQPPGSPSRRLLNAKVTV